MMPGKLLALVELFGYKGDRKFGLELLERAGGWSANGRVVEKEAEGIRRAIYDMLLLIFHLVLSAFRFEDVDVRKASRVLEWNLKRYPNGVFFLFGAGHLAVPSTQKLWSTTHALMVVPGEDEDTIRAKSYKYQPFQSTNKLANDYWFCMICISLKTRASRSSMRDGSHIARRLSFKKRDIRVRFI
jgi:hypothetical protein